MGIEIKLDTAALSSLIDSDPEFKIKVQTAVIANIASKYIRSVEPDVVSAINQVAQDCRKAAVRPFAEYTDKYPYTLKLSDSTREHIKSLVATEVKREYETIVHEMIEAQFANKMKILQTSVDMEVELSMKRYTNEVVGQMIKDRVNKAMEAMKG